jgi:hypothetical protein
MSSSGGNGHVVKAFRVNDRGQVRVGDDDNVNYNFHIASLGGYCRWSYVGLKDTN